MFKYFVDQLVCVNDFNGDIEVSAYPSRGDIGLKMYDKHLRNIKATLRPIDETEKTSSKYLLESQNRVTLTVTLAFAQVDIELLKQALIEACAKIDELRNNGGIDDEELDRQLEERFDDIAETLVGEDR